MAYFISSQNTTPEEPTPGFYFTTTDENGEETIKGPFLSKAEALDEESNGAYSSWLENKRDERYEQDIFDAGRGHLLKR